jgi:hypothetical protein
MAKHLNSEQWKTIQVKYEASNLSNCELATEFGISEGAIRKRAKYEQWDKKVRTDVEQTITALTNLGTSTKKYEPQQTTVLKSIISERLDDLRLFSETTSMVLKAQRNLAVNTINKLAKGELLEHQGAAIFKMQGMTVPELAKLKGVESTAGETQDNMVTIVFED